MEYVKQESWNQPPSSPPENKKIGAGILAILLGPLGIHKFYLGYTTEGFLYLLLSICTCGVL
nr:TM2 domain-containing protein [Flavobacterium sp.]